MQLFKAVVHSAKDVVGAVKKAIPESGLLYLLWQFEVIQDVLPDPLKTAATLICLAAEHHQLAAG